MAMQCNIDARGQRVRRVMGSFALLLGILFGFVAFYSGPWWLWFFSISAIVGGVFMIFEARQKWCALRAMGIKTRI